jgi:putative Mg2+ transporter-C (MgtC) family protein
MSLTFISGIEIDFSIRVIIALFLGLIIGIERVRAHKIAGPRTYGLVAMGSALFVVCGELMRGMIGTDVDAVRIAAQIVAGVGFLGAGIIMFRDNQVTGLTTATGLWVAAGIGVACGFGFYTLATIATCATVITLTILWKLEDKFIAPHDNLR